MFTEVLGFIFTEKCNFRCRHCCNESEPSRSETMDEVEVGRHVREAATLGRFREIGISGGEPFLFPHQLAAVVRSARDSGLSASVTTNGFWARDDERATATLSPLVDAGLTAVSVSISRFHLEFGSPDRVYTACLAALRLGLTTRVNVVRTRGSERRRRPDCWGRTWRAGSTSCRWTAYPPVGPPPPSTGPSCP